MNKKKILIAILLGIFVFTMWFVGIANSKASVVYDTYSLKNNINAVKLYNNSNTLVYGGNDAALNTFNALCVNNDSLHTYLLTEQYYTQVEIYTGDFADGWYFVLDFKNKLYTNDYSFVFNARYDNNIGPYAEVNVYVIYDDNTSSSHNINRNSGETTFIFDYNYFNTNSKLNKNVKSIRFNIPNITSIDVFNNNTNLSYDIGYQNGIDSVINSPNNYNLYSYEQFSSAYNYGFQDGLNTDTSTSYDNGYSTGYTNGYNSGYDYAIQEFTTTGVAPVVNFNQLIQNGNFSNGSNNWSATAGSTIVSATNNVLVYNSNQIAALLQDIDRLKNEHVYYYTATINTNNKNLNVGLYKNYDAYNYIGQNEITTNTRIKLSHIFTAHNVSSTDRFSFRVRVNNNTNTTIYVQDVMLIDLTQIYGTGNEPLNVNDFNDDFPSNYYIFTTSDLINFDYQNGYNKGVQDMNVVVREKQELLNKAINGDLTFTNMFTSIFDVPVQTITGLLNFEFLGVNLLDFFLSIFTICIIIAILKLIL